MSEFTIHSWREAIREAKLTTTVKCVAFVLSMYFREDAETYPSITTLQQDCALSRPSVCQAIKTLKELGFIKIKTRKISSLAYSFSSYEFSGVGKSVSKDDSKTDLPASKDTSKNTSKDTSKRTLPKHREHREHREYKEKYKKESTGNFKKPTVEQIADYCQERGNNIDPQAFFDFYEMKGWRVGKAPMKDWKAAVRTWEKNNKAKNTIPLTAEEKDFIDWFVEVQYDNNLTDSQRTEFINHQRPNITSILEQAASLEEAKRVVQGFAYDMQNKGMSWSLRGIASRYLDLRLDYGGTK